MKPFVRNTVVFTLNKNSEKLESLRKRIKWMQDVLYAMCHKMLAVPLLDNTLHMTLHDLKNGLPQSVSKEEIKSIGRGIKEELSILKKESWRIRLQTTWVFNMVNTSVVIGLEPYTDDDCSQLMELYERLDRIFPLGYPLTPHITLAYYQPGIYHGDDVKKLGFVFSALSEDKITVEFEPEDLLYQEFHDMNHYYSE